MMRAIDRHPGSRRGFTLVESIVAIVILAVAVPPMLWAVRDAHAQRIDTVYASRARWLAIAKIEDVIADRHSTTRGWAHVVDANYPDETPVATDAVFARSVVVTETAADLLTVGTGYKTVTVTVSWTDGSSKPRSLDIVTVLTDYAP